MDITQLTELEILQQIKMLNQQQAQNNQLLQQFNAELGRRVDQADNPQPIVGIQPIRQDEFMREALARIKRLEQRQDIKPEENPTFSSTSDEILKKQN